MDQPPRTSSRIGTFLILVGIGLMLIFIGSYLANKLQFSYLCSSIIIIALGALLRRSATPRQSSSRFRFVRGIFETRKKKQEQEPRSDDPSHFQ